MAIKINISGTTYTLTTDHSASSYDMPVLVAPNGTAYGQMDKLPDTRTPAYLTVSGLGMDASDSAGEAFEEDGDEQANTDMYRRFTATPACVIAEDAEWERRRQEPNPWLDEFFGGTKA